MGDHAVQIYSELDELIASLGRFLDAGFKIGEPGLLIATPASLLAIQGELARRGWQQNELDTHGLLTCWDAEGTLASVMDEETPSAAGFENVVGGMVDEIGSRFPDRNIRAFGEMVNLLYQRGREPAAIALEELWNNLLETRQVALLCGYEIDVFDLDAQSCALPEILRTHTHTRTSADPSRLAAAVDQTLTQVVGRDAAARIYLQVAEDVPLTELSRGQAVLMWLSRHQPGTALRVLQGARGRYAPAG